MPSVSYAQAKQLSHCGVGESYFDSLVTDPFFALLPVEEVEGDCASYPIIRDADKPSIPYVSSGGTMASSAVAYGASADFPLKRIAMQVQVDGAIATNLSQIHGVPRDQALAAAQLVLERVSRELWAVSPTAESPTGMRGFADANPRGSIAPAAGPGTPLVLSDLERLARLVSPLDPTSGLAFVMNPNLYFQMHSLARAAGFEIAHGIDPASGQDTAWFDGIRVLPCGHVPLVESGGDRSSVYLVRIGGGDVRRKIKGVCRLHPVGQTEIDVGPVRASDDAPDVLLREVSWNIAFANYSRTSVAMLTSISPPT